MWITSIHYPREDRVSKWVFKTIFWMCVKVYVHIFCSKKKKNIYKKNLLVSSHCLPSLPTPALQEVIGHVCFPEIKKKTTHHIPRAERSWHLAGWQSVHVTDPFTDTEAQRARVRVRQQTEWKGLSETIKPRWHIQILHFGSALEKKKLLCKTENYIL